MVKPGTPVAVVSGPGGHGLVARRVWAEPRKPYPALKLGSQPGGLRERTHQLFHLLRPAWCSGGLAPVVLAGRGSGPGTAFGSALKAHRNWIYSRPAAKRRLPDRKSTRL